MRTRPTSCTKLVWYRLQAWRGSALLGRDTESLD